MNKVFTIPSQNIALRLVPPDKRGLFLMENGAALVCGAVGQSDK